MANQKTPTAGALHPVYRRRRVLALPAILLVSAMGYAAAYVTVLGLPWPQTGTRTALLALPVLLALRLVASLAFRLQTHRWRYTGVGDLVAAISAMSLSSVGLLVVTLAVPGLGVPTMVVLLELIYSSYLLAGVRIAYRLFFERHYMRGKRARLRGAPKRVLIVGAGEAGSLLSQEMQRYPDLGYDLVAFVDDDAAKIGSQLRGIPVMGPTSRIPKLVSRNHVEEVVLAIPSATPSQLHRIVQACETTTARLSILPHEHEVYSGPVRLSQLREVSVEDLLGREPVELALPELESELRGQTVLITGAAGSIGSELARQAALNGPSVLVLLDQAESDMFFLEMELRGANPDVRIVPVICDVLDEARLEWVFREHAPARVYHAAAYKHVPLMEQNPSEAFRTNVMGTWNVARAAAAVGAGKFVLISTDKAVNPSSVMGTTKRLAELLVISLAGRFPATSFTAVRFGNVLGSQGSVIPVFRRQIAEGQPLTVTHPDATRYFMTIPEAVQLVLQASLLPEARGRVAMLDMGQPVNILEMAKSLLNLAGIDDWESRVTFTGLRPGEKLHEELTYEQEEVSGTANPKVRVVVADTMRWEQELRERMHQFAECHGGAGAPLGEAVAAVLETV